MAKTPRKPLTQDQIDKLWKLDALYGGMEEVPGGVGQEIEDLIDRLWVQLNPNDVPQPSVDTAPQMLPYRRRDPHEE